MTMSPADFVTELSDATQRHDVFASADQQLLMNTSLRDLDLDSLEVVVVGSVLLDLLPREVDIPSALEESFIEMTVGELYHLYAAATDRT